MLVTYTGREFDYKNITKENIFIPDILHSLPRINRFIGHSKRPYSVGEHTYVGLMMAKKLGYTPLQQLQWFKHDFTEAYVGDCPTPLKRLLPYFSEIEAKIERVIEELLGLREMTEEEEKLVKRIDNTMLVLEMRDLTLHDYENFINDLTYTEMLDDKDFSLEKEWFLDEPTSILTKTFDKLLKEYKETRYYRPVACVKTNNYKKTVIEDLKFDDLMDALTYAESFAKSLYYQNPEKDIMEIMKSNHGNENQALEEFSLAMKESIIYWVEEITLEGVIKHFPTNL